MSVDERLLDWYERELRYWTSGKHGQFEQFWMSVMSNDLILTPDKGETPP